MSNRADEQSRVLGGLVVLGAVLAGCLFLAGVASKSYWALAIPVGVAVLFVLGLVCWIGWTIATIQTHPSGEPLPTEGSPGAATQGDTPKPAQTSPPAESATPDS